MDITLLAYNIDGEWAHINVKLHFFLISLGSLTILTMAEAEEDLESQLLHSARNGEASRVAELLKQSRDTGSPSVNCKGRWCT